MTGRIFFRILMILAIIFSCLFIFLTFWNICLPFLLAYIIFYALKPAVTFLEQRGVKHSIAAMTVYLSCFGIFTLVIALVIPTLLSEFSRIKDNVPVYSASVSSLVSSMRNVLSSNVFLSYIVQKTGDPFVILGDYSRSFLQSFLHQAPALLSSVVLFAIVIPFVTFFLLLDEQVISKSLIRLVPNRYFETIVDLLFSLELQFGLILRGMLYGVVVISLVSFIGLWIIGMDYPLAIGIIAGITNLIPYAGPLMGIVFAFLVALISGAPFSMYALVTIVFVFVQLFDNVIVQPVIMAKSANLHPLFLLFLVLIGSSFGGILGMLVIVPLASLSRVVISAFYREMKRPIRPDFSLYRDASRSCDS